MKQIHKKDEPKAFADWKIANQERIAQYINEGKSGNDLWGLLNSNLSKEIVPNDYSKELLRESLVKEQHYICCYCNDKIKGEPLDTKIEHFLPKESNKDKTFHYPNLFASCSGGSEMEAKPPRELSCDSFKSHHDPLKQNINSPLDIDVHKHFSYRENGEILGKTQQGKDTIKFLNLDCKRLQLRRKTVIEGYIYDEENDMNVLLEEVREPIHGKHQAFCMAIINVLENYL